jgi:hypothetical protein
MQFKSNDVNIITLAQAVAARSVHNKPYDHLVSFAQKLVAPASPTDGPGTELKYLLSRFKVTGTCNCDSHAAQMNRWGPDKCEQEIDTIADWLIEEANKRNIPTMFFGRMVAKRLIRIAISRARRKQVGIKATTQRKTSYTSKDAAIVTTHFNVAKFSRTRDTYYEWLPRMGQLANRVVCYEAVLDSDPQEIDNSIVVRGTRKQNGMFQKEALLNLALLDCVNDSTPLFCWIDHDLHYDVDDWLDRGIEILNSDPDIHAVQLFSDFRHYEQDGRVIHKQPMQLGGWCPGGNWIAKTQWLKKIGGFPWQWIIGSGDAAMYEKMTKHCTHLDATVHHLWHGDRENRRYVQRHDDLKSLGFDPSLHVTIDAAGLSAWTNHASPKLRQYVLDYFAGRREDG